MFTTDTIFNSSHKMGVARITLGKAIAKFGDGNKESADDKSEYLWDGEYTAIDGTPVRASFWDWEGGLRAGYGVSVWVHDQSYLSEFIKFLED